MNEDKDFSPAFVEDLIRGDSQSFALLVEKTSARIYKLALRMVNNEQDAEDVLQETYIKAYRALPEFEGRSSITTWLYRIAANEALMILRKRKPLQRTVELDDDNDESESATVTEVVDWRFLPEKEMASAETRQMLEQAVERLSVPLKLVFILRDIQGFSGRETAEILGINENAVKTRLVRARMKLREDLSSYFRERVGTEVQNG